jgi:hypothetical protein
LQSNSFTFTFLFPLVLCIWLLSMLLLLLLSQARLDKQTAGLAEGSPVVCLFVNDNCDAPVSGAILATYQPPASSNSYTSFVSLILHKQQWQQPDIRFCFSQHAVCELLRPPSARLSPMS